MYVNRRHTTNIIFLDIILRPVLFKTQRFGDWILSPSSRKTYSVMPNRQSWSMSQESPKSCVLNKNRTKDDFQRHKVYICLKRGTTSIDSVPLNRFYLKTEKDSSLRSAVFHIKRGRWLMSRNIIFVLIYHRHKTYSVACSLQANYTYRATAACRRIWCQLLRIEGVTLSAQWVHTAVNLGFLDRSRYFFAIASQLSSRG
jgi:hypothetical protein